MELSTRTTKTRELKNCKAALIPGLALMKAQDNYKCVQKYEMKINRQLRQIHLLMYLDLSLNFV